MYYVGANRDGDQRLKKAMLVACVAHVALAFGISFNMPEQSNSSARQIEVTLAMQPSAAAPLDARMLAQANQVGPDEENHFEPPPPPPQARAKAPETPNSTATLATRSNSRRIEDQLDTLNPEVARLRKELEELEAELQEQTEAYEDRPRVRRLSAATARQSVDAAYLHQWRARLEAVGNRYYPEASVRYGIYGDLRLLVVIRYDGTLEDVRVLDSSGYAVLDEAAIKIVRMAAPYPPFPEELRATTDKLEIVRTWQFQENALSSG